MTDGLLPTLRVLPFGVSRKRLEQAIRELQLPVIVARNIDEADVVMTLRSEYRSKPPTVRDAEERGMPVYVLKSNTILQMHASLTSIFSLALDPREAALRETEEAIGMVIERSEAVELSPQSAYIRRLQHQMAERANLVSLAWPRTVPARPALPGPGPGLALERQLAARKLGACTRTARRLGGAGRGAARGSAGSRIRPARRGAARWLKAGSAARLGGSARRLGRLRRLHGRLGGGSEARRSAARAAGRGCGSARQARSTRRLGSARQARSTRRDSARRGVAEAGWDR